MAREDEFTVPTRLGDSPPLLPFRKPFDLTGWQFVLFILTLVAVANVDSTSLSSTPFIEDSPISPKLMARFAVAIVGGFLVFVQPGGRMLLVWLLVWAKHAFSILPAVLVDEHGTRYFDADATQMTLMRMQKQSTIFEVDPPLWWLVRRLPDSVRTKYWNKHVPYRVLFPVEPEGALELLTDGDKAARWASLTAGLLGLTNPVQIVAQARPEDPEWLVSRALPPHSSPFAFMRPAIERWVRARAGTMMQRRVVVTCSAADPDVLAEHVRDVRGMLEDSALTVREADRSESLALFEQTWGNKHFYPKSTSSFRIDETEWVTIVVRSFPRNCVVGWINFITGALPVDMALYFSPDDAGWLTKVMEWFEGMCELPTADTAHKDAYADCAMVEGKIKRNEDSIQRTTMLLTMPKDVVPRVTNRLRKSGAIFRSATFEHAAGRGATLPIGGLPRMGVTRPYDGASVAGVYPFGTRGLRTRNGRLIGVGRESNEAVTLDMLDESLYASMIAILGTTGSGKTFLIQQLIERSGLPFVLIDMKPHLDEDHYGDYFRFTTAANGQYTVVRPGEPLPKPHPFAQCYNLALLDDAERAHALAEIGELEWDRAVDSLEDRIFAVDEANSLGQTEAGQRFVEKVATQGRSVGFVGIFASQEVDDFLRNFRLQKAVKMSSILFVLAQEQSEVANICDRLALGDATRAEIAKYQPSPDSDKSKNERHALVKIGRRICAVTIEACPEEIALFTTKPSHKRAMREANTKAREVVTA